MDDIIFERDYREAESGEYDEWCDEVFDRAVNGGMLKAYSDAMDKYQRSSFLRTRRTMSTFWNAAMRLWNGIVVVLRELLTTITGILKSICFFPSQSLVIRKTSDF